MLAMKHFEKDIGSLEMIIKDAALEEKSQELSQFLNSAVKTFRALQERTTWSNRAELHIALIKEAVRKDMKEVDSPLAF